MGDGFAFVVGLVAAVLTGLMAGIFVAFSAGIMQAIGRLADEHGGRAMQAINVAVINPVFLGVFLGAGLASVVAGATAIMQLDEPGGWLAVAGAVLYLAGAWGLTGGVNVPMNNRLAGLDAGSAAGQAYWREYVRRWTAWNHARAISSTASCVAYVLAIAA